MRTGWRKLIKQYFTRRNWSHVVGIELADSGMHVSAFLRQNDGLCCIAQQYFPQQDCRDELRQWLDATGVLDCYCELQLDKSHYQLLQVDKPAVPETELVQALRWSVKDLLPNVDSYILDYFDHPAQIAGTDKLTVVAADRNVIQTYCTMIQDAGLVLQGISIAEMTMCALLPVTDKASIVLSQRANRELMLLIVKAGKIYFIRHLKGYEQLCELTLEQMRSGLLMSLATELQRSMDYFESQLRQAPLTDIVLVLDSREQTGLATELANMLPVTVHEMVFPVKARDIKLSRTYPGSIGAALLIEQTKLSEDAA